MVINCFTGKINLRRMVKSMNCDALKQVINLSRKNPRMLFNVSFFEKLCERLEINYEISGEKFICSLAKKKADAVIITAGNCASYKCSVKEGIRGVRIFEFILILVSLLSTETVAPSPHEGAGSTAQYYVEEGTKILEKLAPC